MPGRSANDASSAYQLSQLAQDRIITYANLVASPQVLEPVIQKIGLSTSPGQLADSISASNIPGTVLLDVQAQDSDPQLAAQLANETAASLTKTIQDLETPLSGGASPLRATVTSPAEVPGAPVSPRPLLALAVSLFLGAVAGIGLVIAAGSLDKRIRSEGELAEATGSTSLGTVPASRELRRSGGIQGGDLVDELVRGIRTNIKFAAIDRQMRTLAFASAAEGEGKTTVAIQVATSMAAAGLKVCLVDLDLRRARVAEALGIDGSVGVTNVLVEDVPLRDALVEWNRGLLQVLPAGITAPNPAEVLASRGMTRMLAELATEFDVVLLDCAPILPVADGSIAAAAADGTVLVARYRATKTHSAGKAATMVRKAGGQLLGSILNRVPTQVQSYTGYYAPAKK